MPEDWNTENATYLGITGKCAQRNCLATEVCVPTISTTGVKDGACLSYPAVCDQLSVNGGDVVYNAATLQEQSATWTCRPGHYMLPAVASGQLTCDVIGQWSPVGVSCKQVLVSITQLYFRGDLLRLRGWGWGVTFVLYGSAHIILALF
jgi:hypothetical protein